MDGQATQRGDLAERIERVTEVPMILLALAYVVVFVVGLLPDLSPGALRAAEFAEYVIIALFAAELAVRIAVAERRWAYLRAHWLDLVVVAVPFLRPLRLLRLVRIAPVALRAALRLRRIMGPYRGAYVVVLGLVSVFTSAVVVLAFERRAEGNIADFEDALWWAAATITTVGYGDKSPVTPEGRAVAVFLMVIGIALFSMLTAGIAAYFVEGPQDEDRRGVTTKDLMVKLEVVQAQLDEQQRALQALVAFSVDRGRTRPPEGAGGATEDE